MVVSSGRVEVFGAETPRQREILTPAALDFVAALQAKLGATRADVLARRIRRGADLSRGVLPRFPAETRSVRASEWWVRPAPADLEDRRVEITGPVDRKMMINALNSGASVFMADFEDALSPTWRNVVEGQANLVDAVDGTIEFRSPDGKEYRLGPTPATLVVRPRGWHLVERHVRVDGEPVSASLFDFGVYAFHNHAALRARGSGPYFYLPKLESHLEARLWKEAFGLADETQGLSSGTIRAKVLIETIHAAIEVDEILYQLRDH
ncbi:MAG: malate synthase A, partial [Methanobacteriota archaeon]